MHFLRTFGRIFAFGWLGVALWKGFEFKKRLMSLRHSTQTMVVSLVILLTGCKDREITAYRAAKDKPDAAMPPAAAADTNNLPPGHPPIGVGASGQPAPGGDMAGTTVPTASGSDLRWTAPAAWTTKPLGQMRKGSFAIKGAGGEADLSITAFPGDTGGLHANLNRWRGQVGLPAASPAELDAALAHLDGQGLHFEVIDLVGPGGTPGRMLGAITSYGGNSWFFKLMGPDALVAAEKPAFLEFLKTVKAP